jgi:hypothetical protein
LARARFRSLFWSFNLSRRFAMTASVSKNIPGYEGRNWQTNRCRPKKYPCNVSHTISATSEEANFTKAYPLEFPVSIFRTTRQLYTLPNCDKKFRKSFSSNSLGRWPMYNTWRLFSSSLPSSSSLSAIFDPFLEFLVFMFPLSSFLLFLFFLFDLLSTTGFSFSSSSSLLSHSGPIW